MVVEIMNVGTTDARRYFRIDGDQPVRVLIGAISRAKRDGYTVTGVQPMAQGSQLAVLLAKQEAQ